MAYEIKIENLRELQANFKKFPQIADKELQTATKEAGKRILQTEKEEVPVKTATLKRSITFDYRPIQASIFPTVKYALPLHDGSKPHTIVPSKKRVLAFKSGGKMIFTRKVKHPGYKGNRFVERTVKKTSGKVNDLFSKCLDNIIKLLVK
jgi:hypothetical protein